MVDSPELKRGYADLVAAWRSLERTHALRVDEVDCDGGASSLLVVDIGARVQRPCVAFAAGVHGDEPAAPWALLNAVRDGLLDERLSYRVWCCSNPDGYRAGTRENADGVDVNRSFSRDGCSATTPQARAIERKNQGRHFVLSFDLHEDYEASGFYCYEPIVETTAPLGRRVVESLDDAGLPVQDIPADFDLGYLLDAPQPRAIERGRVMPNVEEEVRHFRGLPYSMYLLWTGTARRTMTFESPSSRAWGDRIAMHRVAIVAALEAARGAPPGPPLGRLRPSAARLRTGREEPGGGRGKSAGYTPP